MRVSQTCISNVILPDCQISLFSKFAGLFEGDILIDEDTERYLTGGDIVSRDAVISPVLYWPKGIFYYMFDDKLGLFRSNYF